MYEVTITYVTPQSVTTTQNPGQPCKSSGPCSASGVNGRPCISSLHTFCHSFGALFAASTFRSQKAAEAAALFDNCGYNPGTTAVYSAGGITGIEGTGAYGECEDVSEPPGDSGAPGANSGQTFAPGLKTGDPDNAPTIET